MWETCRYFPLARARYQALKDMNDGLWLIVLALVE